MFKWFWTVISLGADMYIRGDLENICVQEIILC